MPTSLVTVSYLVAAVLFIMSLGGLSAQQSARRGNGFGIAGMFIAVPVNVAMGEVVRVVVVVVNIHAKPAVIQYFRHRLKSLCRSMIAPPNR